MPTVIGPVDDRMVKRLATSGVTVTTPLLMRRVLSSALTATTVKFSATVSRTVNEAVVPPRKKAFLEEGRKITLALVALRSRLSLLATGLPNSSSAVTVKAMVVLAVTVVSLAGVME